MQLALIEEENEENTVVGTDTALCTPPCPGISTSVINSKRNGKWGPRAESNGRRGEGRGEGLLLFLTSVCT
jgi:hypothetical protein